MPGGKSKIQPAPKVRGRLSAFVLLDKAELVCYDDAVILTLSEIRCVKGANMVFLPRNPAGDTAVAVPLGHGNFSFWRGSMQTRVAVMSIIVENPDAVEQLNAMLHTYGEYIIGRMGIPYRKRGVNIIAIALDAPQDTISALAGKIGSLTGISVKTAYSGVTAGEQE